MLSWVHIGFALFINFVKSLSRLFDAVTLIVTVLESLPSRTWQLDQSNWLGLGHFLSLITINLTYGKNLVKDHSITPSAETVKLYIGTVR